MRAGRRARRVGRRVGTARAAAAAQGAGRARLAPSVDVARAHAPAFAAHAPRVGAPLEAELATHERLMRDVAPMRDAHAQAAAGLDAVSAEHAASRRVEDAARELAEIEAAIERAARRERAWRGAGGAQPLGLRDALAAAPTCATSRCAKGSRSTSSPPSAPPSSSAPRRGPRPTGGGGATAAPAARSAGPRRRTRAAPTRCRMPPPTASLSGRSSSSHERLLRARGRGSRAARGPAPRSADHIHNDL